MNNSRLQTDNVKGLRSLALALAILVAILIAAHWGAIDAIWAIAQAAPVLMRGVH